MQALINPTDGERAAPPVSVVMPVHNALPFLDESVASILSQTFADFEFVILDDASTDGSAEALRRWAHRDARIRLYRSTHKLGLAGSSNFVVARARAPLVARMDADDISHPERLRRQLDALKNRPDVALVGTLYEGIDAAGRRVRPRDRWRLARRSVFPPFPHGSVMFRREVFEEAGGYRAACDGWEDQDLFLRIVRRGRVVVLTDALYRYRFQVNSATARWPARVMGLRHRCLAELTRGRDYTRFLQEAGGNGHPSNERNGHDPDALASVIYLRGSMRLWAGDRPHALGPLCRRESFGLSPRFLRTLVWAAWAGASPESLRLFLRSVIRARDLLAGWRVRDGGLYEWRLK
jgi:glycosyltransferase involved in cell wall biosynthesis